MLCSMGVTFRGVKKTAARVRVLRMIRQGSPVSLEVTKLYEEAFQ